MKMGESRVGCNNCQGYLIKGMLVVKSGMGGKWNKTQ